LRRKRYVPLLVLLWIMAPNLAFAFKFVPLEWQELVTVSSRPHSIGQYKHVSWIRDKNHNFVDDLIDSLYHSGDSVDVVVDFNRNLTPTQVDSLVSPLGGQLTYIAKLISCAFVRRALVSRLDSVATRPEVAAIEWQVPTFPINDTATRAIQARSSSTYSVSAEGTALGSLVNIAVLDTGVKDAHEAFTPTSGTAAFVEGYDATAGGVVGNPEPTTKLDDHGTAVASMALGRSSSKGKTCRDPGGVAADCAGAARQAGLIDVKVCSSNDDCRDDYIMAGIDWVGLNRDKGWGSSGHGDGIQVANLSIGSCVPDDGTTSQPKAVDYLAAIGIIPVVGHGNAGGKCTSVPGTTLTGAPGSASLAITVSGVNDQKTVPRSDDTYYSGHLLGPRSDFTSEMDTPLAMKPDICAPAENIMAAAENPGSSVPDPNSAYFWAFKGTSMATAFVSGAAALVRQTRPRISPGSLKRLLIEKADKGLVGFSAYAGTTAWDAGFGSGELDVGDAVTAPAVTDITFPNCIGDGSPCQLTSPMDSWNNYLDITTASPPQVNVANVITATVKNSGSHAAMVLVNFGIYDFTAANPVFYPLGTKTGTVEAGLTLDFTWDWTPTRPDHQCVQVSVDYAYDSDDGNNVTQRNLMVAASQFDMRVENPYSVPAYFRVVPRPAKGWLCKLSPDHFSIDPLKDRPQMVRVKYTPPAGAQPGEHKDCPLSVYARKQGSRDSVLIGGATVRTVVPKACVLRGTVLDTLGHEVLRADITMSPMEKNHDGHTYATIKKTASAGGRFSAELYSYIPYRISIRGAKAGNASMDFRWWGGHSAVFELGRKGLRVTHAK